MNYAEFVAQMGRLKKYFRNGDGVYNRERVALIWPIVRGLPDLNFKSMVDEFIGENTPDWPPRISDFREQAAKQQRLLFRETAKSVGMKFNNDERSPKEDGGLQRTLADLGVKSLVDAIQKKPKPQEG